MNNKKGIVLESSNEEIEKLSRKWEKWENRKKLGERLLKIGSSGFIVTLLSPFDFEGPLAEIATAVLAGTGFALKEFSEFMMDTTKEKEESQNFQKVM